MAALGTKLNRPEVSEEDINHGCSLLILKLNDRLRTKGKGAYASRHEILGILEEEMDEVKDAIRDDTAEGYIQYRKELLDVAVGALFGFICMNDYIKPY